MKSVTSSEKHKKLLHNQLPGLLRFSLALTGSVDAAEALMQDCINRALDQFDQWHSDQKLSVWLHTILHQAFVDFPDNTSQNDLKTNTRITTLTKSGDNDATAVKIANLPKDQREVLLLITLLGLDYKSVVEIVGLPASAVMSRLHNARKSLLYDGGSLTVTTRKPRFSDEILEI